MLDGTSGLWHVLQGLACKVSLDSFASCATVSSNNKMLFSMQDVSELKALAV